jgi:hypothetical protein
LPLRPEHGVFEVLELEKALATGEFGDLDGEAVRQMLAEAARLAQGPLAESFADGDRNPPEFDPESHGALTRILQGLGARLAGGSLPGGETNVTVPESSGRYAWGGEPGGN